MSHLNAAYLQRLLGFKKPEQLVEFLSQPDRPTGGMRPPDSHYEAIRELQDEEERAEQPKSRKATSTK